MAEPLLHVSGIETCYGQSQVLFGIAFDIRAGEVATHYRHLTDAHPAVQRMHRRAPPRRKADECLRGRERIVERANLEEAGRPAGV